MSLGFLRAERLTLQHLEETSDPVYASRRAGDVLLVMVAGLIAFAVANEMVIAHPHGHTSAALSLLLYGGLILFLVALGWHSWLVLRVWPRPHLVGSAALVPVGIVALAVPPYVALVLVGASLTTLALLDRRWMPDRTAKSISSGSRRSPPDSLSRIFENARRQTAPA